MQNIALIARFTRIRSAKSINSRESLPRCLLTSCALLQITAAARPDHAQYIACYLRMLKEDKRAIFRAAAAAAVVADFIMAFTDGEGAS